MEICDFFNSSIELANNSHCETGFRYVADGLNRFISVEQLKNHSLEAAIGDTIFVNDIEFCLEAINRAGRYVFVSKEILAIKPMEKINRYLTRLENDIPDDLLEAIVPCDHGCGDENPHECGYTNGNKLWIPSYYNLFIGESADGNDDVIFRRMRIRSKRIKKFCGEPTWFWLDTPLVRSDFGLLSVCSDGDASGMGSSGSSCLGGVCVAFSI